MRRRGGSIVVLVDKAALDVGVGWGDVRWGRGG